MNDAIADFTRVLDVDPNHVNAAYARAACYNSKGQFSKAIEDYNIALMKDQEKAEVWTRCRVLKQRLQEVAHHLLLINVKAQW